MSAGLEHELRDDLFEEMAAFVAGAKQMDLGSFPATELLELWEGQERKVLDVFGPRLLLPGLIAATALGELRTFLQETLWDEDADALAQTLFRRRPARSDRDSRRGTVRGGEGQVVRSKHGWRITATGRRASWTWP